MRESAARDKNTFGCVPGVFTWHGNHIWVPMVAPLAWASPAG